MAALEARKPQLRQAARQMNVQYSTVHRWETGETFPTPENLERLASALGCEPLELLMRPDLVTVWRSVVTIIEAKAARNGKP